MGPAFAGELSGRELVPISDIANMPAKIVERTKKVEDGAGGLVDQSIKFPVWFEPVANGGTPMCQALGQARMVIEGWLSQHPNCFPPAVIHITDGESTDGSPTDAMRSLTGLTSADGNVLLLTLHLSSNPDAAPVAFPDSTAALPDEYARTMFEGTSPLTASMRSVARELGLNLSDGARGFVLNGNMKLVIQGLEIGTSTETLR